MKETAWHTLEIIAVVGLKKPYSAGGVEPSVVCHVTPVVS